MADKAGKFQIVIKGGQPWGFRLHGDPENRFAVIVDQIEPGGKADVQGDLEKGDYIIKINDVQCLSLSDALQLIDSAFRTLTVLVWRPPEKCKQGNINDSSVFYPKSFISFSSHCPNSASNSMLSSVFHEFQDYKDNISTRKLYRKVTHTRLTNNYENISSLNVINHYASNLKTDLQCFVDQSNQTKILENFSSEDISLKNNRSIRNKEILTEQNNFLDSASVLSNHNTNLQFVCEKVPLPEIFFSNSADLKLKLQPIMQSKKTRIFSQSVQVNQPELIEKHQASVERCSEKETTANTITKIGYCMYPNCNQRNINCTIHSPPEKDDAQHVERNDSVSQCKNLIFQNSSNVEQISCHISLNNLHAPSLMQNSSISVPTNAVKSANHDKYDMTANSAIPNNCDPLNKVKCHFSQDNEYFQSDCKHLYTSTSSKMQVTQHSDQTISSFAQAGRKNHSFKHQLEYLKSVTTESIPNISVKRTMLYDQAREIQVLGSGSKSFRKQAMKLSLFNQSADNLLSDHSTKNKCFTNEESSLFSGTKINPCLKFSEMRTVKLYTHADEKDVEEDEELCFIEEKVRNMLKPSYTLSASPDLPLPPSPVNSLSEIIPTNEPLPSPPCLSPVEDLLNHEKPEALYANLEMLKIKCAVVNSSTQTAASSKQQNDTQNDSAKEPENITSFSCFRSDVSNNTLAPPFEKTVTNSVIKNLLREQFQNPAVEKSDTSHNSEKKVILERQSLSLPLTSAYFTTSEPKAKLLTRYVSSLNEKNITFSGELSNTKEELMASIAKKLEVLKLEQVALQEEVKQNDELGKCIADKIEKAAKPNESKKFHIQVEELVKITNLMLSLSGRLARAENALLILPSNASEEEKAVLELKFSKLKQQYEEARILKSNIDKRNNHLSLLLRRYFSEDDWTDYDHFIRMKAKLLVDLKELDEKIKLGEEQLSDLQISVHNHKN